MLRDIIAKPVKFDSSQWTEVGPEAMELAAALLNKKPHHRPTIEEVQEHLWLVGKPVDMKAKMRRESLDKIWNGPPPRLTSRKGSSKSPRQHHHHHPHHHSDTEVDEDDGSFLVGQDFFDNNPDLNGKKPRAISMGLMMKEMPLARGKENEPREQPPAPQ